MKMNHTYEVAIKRAVASFMEVRELRRLAKVDIHHFHNNLDTRYPSIELLNKINYRQEGDILIFDIAQNSILKDSGNKKGNFMGRQ